MESEVEGTPLTAEGSGSAGTRVLERPGVEAGVPGPTLVAPSDAPPVAQPVAPPARELQAPSAASANLNPRIWEILTAWRAAIRAIATTEPETSAWYARHAELVGLRALYHALFDKAAAAPVAPRRMVLVGRPQAAGDEGVVVVEDGSADGAATHDPGA